MTWRGSATKRHEVDVVVSRLARLAQTREAAYAHVMQSAGEESWGDGKRWA